MEEHGGQLGRDKHQRKKRHGCLVAQPSHCYCSLTSIRPSTVCWQRYTLTTGRSQEQPRRLLVHSDELQSAFLPRNQANPNLEAVTYRHRTIPLGHFPASGPGSTKTNLLRHSIALLPPIALRLSSWRVYYGKQSSSPWPIHCPFSCVLTGT